MGRQDNRPVIKPPAPRRLLAPPEQSRGDAVRCREQSWRVAVPLSHCVAYLGGVVYAVSDDSRQSAGFEDSECGGGDL